MTDDTLEQRAERLLQDITPGEWTWGCDGIEGCYFIPEVPTGHSPHGLPLEKEADAEFIAAAPRLVRSLLALLQQHEAPQWRSIATEEGFGSFVQGRF